MTIADDVKTVLTNQATLATAVQGIATKINNLPAGQTVDLSQELSLLNQINADLQPTPAAPAPAPDSVAPTPTPAPIPDPAPEAA